MKLSKVWEKFGRPAAMDAKCTAKHIQEVELYLSRWRDYWKSKKNKEANRLPGCKRSHMEEWRRHLVTLGFAPRTVNKHLATIRHILVVAEQHEIITSRPRLEQLQEPDSTKLFLRNEQIDQLFGVAHQLEWPSTAIPPGKWWQCAMVLWRTYGFRTQELIAFEQRKTPITWKNISFDSQSPNLESVETNEFGWLFYTPPKTQKKKPRPIFLPLTKYTHCALRIMQKAIVSDNSAIFCNPKNSERVYREWYRWMDLAGVRPRSQGAKFNPYVMRKTCATYANQFLPGLASAICRWGNSAEAKVASDHYVSDELLLQRIHDMPMPISFDCFLTTNHL